MIKSNKIVRQFKSSQISSVISALLLLLIVVTIFSPKRFWKIGNIITVASNASIIGIIACGMTLVIILGGIDLSIAANAAYAAIVMGFFYTNLGMSPVISLVIGLVVSAVFGFANGTIIASLKFNPMITTLAMQLVIRALCYTSNNALAIAVGGTTFKALGCTKVIGLIPIYILYFVAVIFIFHYILTKTAFGRRIFAIGGNESAT